MSRKFKPYMRRRPPSRGHRAANREAQQSGANAEYLVEQAATLYATQGRANVRKRYEPYRRVGGVKEGLFKAVNIGASGPDFELWLDDGRAGLMEVKSRKGKRVQLGAVGGPQAEALERLSRWGHLALVLVRLAGAWYLVDFRAWTHASKRSLNEDDLERQGARVDITPHGFPDFLASIDLAQERATAYLRNETQHDEPEDEDP
jgi:hypothetical protein